MEVEVGVMLWQHESEVVCSDEAVVGDGELYRVYLSELVGNSVDLCWFKGDNRHWDL